MNELLKVSEKNRHARTTNWIVTSLRRRLRLNLKGLLRSRIFRTAQQKTKKTRVRPSERKNVDFQDVLKEKEIHVNYTYTGNNG